MPRHSFPCSSIQSASTSGSRVVTVPEDLSFAALDFDLHQAYSLKTAHSNRVGNIPSFEADAAVYCVNRIICLALMCLET